MLIAAWTYCIKRPLSFLVNTILSPFYPRAYIEYRNFLNQLLDMPLGDVADLLYKTIKFRDDPLGGALDYIASPQITWARGFGDCDDVVEIWGNLLSEKRIKAYRLTILTLPICDSHVLCLFHDTEGWKLADNGGLYQQSFSTREDAVRYLRRNSQSKIIDCFLERFGG
jgi:hypothetical protein